MSLKFRVLWPTLAVLSLLTVAWVARGADPAAGKNKPAAIGNGPAKGGPDPVSDRADKSLREQDIYIPYDKLRQVFEKHGRGVFLPYEKFEELWRAAQEKSRPDGEAPAAGRRRDYRDRQRGRGGQGRSPGEGRA